MTFLLLGIGRGVASETTSVNGIVRDAGSGRPVAGVAIFGRDASGAEYRLKTDMHGRFFAIGVASGKLSFAAATSAPGSQEVSCDVPSGDAVRFDLALRYVGMADTPVNFRSHCEIEPDTIDRYVIR